MRRLGIPLILGTTAVVAVLLVSALTGPGGHALPASPGRGGFVPEVTPANFSVVNISANNTTVDLSMAFNVSVDIVNLTGGAINATNTSNFSFVWSGLPAFVPGDAGSGCYGVSPLNYSFIGANDSSLLNCTAASTGTLKISVTVTNITTSQVNTSATLSIVVNPLPTVSAFTVASATTSAGSSISVPLNTTISFAVSASGGTSPLSFEYTGLPLGCSSTAASFSCAPDRAGVYDVNVTGVDAYGYTTSQLTVTVTVTGAAKTSSSGIGTSGWAVVIGILVVGALVTVALLVQARREDRRGQMGMEEATEPSSPESGQMPPPPGGTPPPGPPS